MADFPNIVDMIFGRIDRNRDTQYRDRQLAQQQSQFDAGQTLDRERLSQQASQFEKTFGLDREKFMAIRDQADAEQRRQANEFVAKRLFKPVSAEDAAPTMQPGGLLQPGRGFSFGGQTLEPVDQPEEQVRQATAMRQAELDLQDKQRGKETQYWLSKGHSPIMASMMAANPNVAMQLMSSPQAMLSVMLDSNAPQSVVNRLIEQMGKFTASQALAGETPSARQMHNASAAAGFAGAGLHNLQASIIRDDIKYRPIASAMFTKTMGDMVNIMPNTGDPNFPTRFNEQLLKNIQAANLPPEAAQRAFDIAQKQLIENRPMGSNPAAALFSGLGLTTPQPTTPPQGVTPSTRPSGSAPAAVNNKPADVTGPPGTAPSQALQYTQPTPAPMTRLPNGQRYTIRGDLNNVLVDPVTNQPIQAPNGGQYYWQNNSITTTPPPTAQSWWNQKFKLPHAF